MIKDYSSQQPTAELTRNPELPTTREVVYILDGGAQYAMDIEQMLKRQGFYAERVPFETPLEELQGSRAIILSGGPESVYDPAAPRCDPRLLEPRGDRPPILGICYGAQLINQALGGSVAQLADREDGFTDLLVETDSELFSGLAAEQQVLMSHGDTMVDLAPGFDIIARSGDMIAAIANPTERLYGLQFHPEVSTAEGPAMLRNFLQQVADMEPEYTYSAEEFIEDAVTEVREKVGDRQVLAYISGGVDSSALAKLLERALPADQIFLVLVDHGYMRAGEIEQVTQMLADTNIHVHVVDASESYKTATTTIDGEETPPLDTVSSPEIKRKIIGDMFIRVQEQMAEELGLDSDNYVLAMGTLYTDLIESGSKHASDNADTIKTHHNDTELVRELRDEGRVLEPWRFIQKDDVRAAGKQLGLPADIYERQPFPGPGLAIRVICGDRPYIPENYDQLLTQLRTFDTKTSTASLLPIQTVGVQGDARTYGHLAVLSGKMDWPKLKSIANEIPRKVRGVNRVAYVFGKPLEKSPDSLTPTFLTDEVIDELKLIDATVNHKLEQHGLDKTISQVPVILLPVNFGEPGKRSVGIRTFKTTNFKTGDIAMPGVDFPEDVLLEVVNEILALPDIARVLYDLTSKPPGTTEWE